MTHTNLQTCPQCGDRQLIREFRDTCGALRKRCRTCREHKRQQDHARDLKPELSSPVIRALRTWRRPCPST
jgi:uncharacterized protein (DUF983 family)